VAEKTGFIYVLAGTNGAGKSSIAGEMLLACGTVFFNPDDAARLILEKNPGISQPEANSTAWQEGKRLLERAIREKSNYAFETTLGGKTITRLLQMALSEGIEVRMWYVGLEGVDLHIARVRSRVRQGGHDIPEERIRQRYTESRLHLIDLVPRLTELFVYDNSKEADPAAGVAPEPELVLHRVRGRIIESCAVDRVPQWAKPIFAAALKSTAGH
jgi:predicted ABC-type ATPase